MYGNTDIKKKLNKRNSNGNSAEKQKKWFRVAQKGSERECISVQQNTKQKKKKFGKSRPALGI